ncbi:MAG: hypothetical protein GY757_34370, partial [bacterium]|nr:hypothetical protein [bacterium]
EDGIDCEESAESWARSGKYSFKNLKPGQYRLEVYFNNDGKEYDIYKKVNIEKNVLKYFDIQIKKR